MKLARVNHERCGQPAGKWGLTSYFWIEDDITQEAFEELCEKAREAYLSAERALQASSPVPAPGYGPNAALYPDTMTVAEIKADYELKAAAYKAHQDLINAARHSFSWHLVNGSHEVQYLWNVPSAVTHDLSWGHNHGVTVDYGETKLGDYPPVEDDEEYL